MRIITVKIELIIPDMQEEDIPDYLNTKLYTDPEFFFFFYQDNIVKNTLMLD